MPAPTYERAPSEELKSLLAPGGFLAPLLELNRQAIGGHGHDVHLGRNDEIQVYRGQTRVLTVRRRRDGGVNVTADAAYTLQPCARGLFRRWRAGESGFGEALTAYLRGVKVAARWTAGEGAVQQQWSRVTKPWVPFDREAVLEYASQAHRAEATAFPEIEAALGKLTGIVRAHRWAAPKSGGRELDQLAIDQDERLVLIELKGDKSSADYYTPFQLLQYVWEWYSALDAVRGNLQTLIDARVAVGLTPPDVSRLTSGIRAAIGLGYDTRTPEVKRRYGVVLNIVNQHLPPDVDPIETWEYADTGPRRVA